MKRKFLIPGLTRPQVLWLKQYEDVTGFEPMHLDELRDGSMTFNEVAKSNINWYEAHMHDAYHAISTHVPYTEL